MQSLFDPAQAPTLNRHLQARWEEIRSLILDGNIPSVRVLLCNNGAIWKHPEAQEFIERAGFGNRVAFEHVNHDALVKILQSSAPVKDIIQFSGKAMVEDFDYTRVLLGKVTVAELARLMDSHGERLLYHFSMRTRLLRIGIDRNIRRYLGLQGNRVNVGIQQTLASPEERSKFFSTTTE